MDQQAPADFTLVDAARRLNVSVTTVRRLVKSGALPSFRVGRLIRIDESDLNTWKKRGGGKAA